MQTVKDPEIFARKAEAIYARRYRDEFESKYHGKIVAIEVQSGDAFVGKTELDAIDKARKKYPDRLFFFLRVGYKAAQRIASPQYHKLPTS